MPEEPYHSALQAEEGGEVPDVHRVRHIANTGTRQYRFRQEGALTHLAHDPSIRRRSRSPETLHPIYCEKRACPDSITATIFTSAILLPQSLEHELETPLHSLSQ